MPCLRPLLLSLVLAVPCVALADEVHLRDGTRIVGTIQAVANNEIVIATEFMGELKLPIEHVYTARTDEPRELLLDTGETVVESLRISDGNQLLGDGRALPLESVQGIRAPGAADIPLPPIVPPQPEPAADWSGKVEFGLNGRTGNTERLNLRLLSRANRTTDVDRLKLYFDVYFAEEESTETERKILTGAEYERDINERTYGFVNLALEHDKPRGIDLRTTLTGGLGYFLIKREDHFLKARGGLGVQYTDLTDDGREVDAVMDLGYDYQVDIRKYVRFVHDATFFSPLDEPEDYRLIVNTAGELPLGSDSPWRITLGMRNEYDNAPPPDIDHFDTWYYLTLGYVWD